MVGKEPNSQRFTVYTNVLTTRSDFLKAARKPEWVADHTKPTDLGDEDPEVFSRYLNCVYFGVEALGLHDGAPKDDGKSQDYAKPELGPDAFHCSEREHRALFEEELKEQTNGNKYLIYLSHTFLILAKLYLLADRLQDMKTANLVIDEIICFCTQEGKDPGPGFVRLVYESTVHGHPLRKWLRDSCVYDTCSSYYMQLHVSEFHSEFARDVMVEFVRLRDCNATRKVEDVYKMNEEHGMYTDKCYYHQHNEGHPRCVPEPKR